MDTFDACHCQRINYELNQPAQWNELECSNNFEIKENFIHINKVMLKQKKNDFKIVHRIV